MTKREYFNLKGLHTYSPSFNPYDELDNDFKYAVDTLVDNFDEIYDDEECEECENCRRWTCLECPYADI